MKTLPPVVYIIDDDESIRLALDSLFRSVGFATQSFSSTADFLNAKRTDAEGCLVLDIRLQGMSGLDFQDQLIASGIYLPVILITGHGDIPMSVRAMKSGAVDFLTKPFRDQDMLDAVSAALKRDRQHRARQRIVDELDGRLRELSPREQQVMTMVARGLLNKQIAGELGISEITVKIHRGAAMRKMKARNLPELVRMSQILNERDGAGSTNTCV